MGLTEDELAYMRETQAEHRPTQANLVRRTETPDGMGGTDYSSGEPQPIAVRVSQADKVPEALADKYGAGVVSITMDLVVTTSGDAVQVGGSEAYEVVSDGAIGAWTTAQEVLAVRTTWPSGGA